LPATLSPAVIRHLSTNYARLFFKQQNINLSLITDPVENRTTLVGLNWQI